MFFQTFSILTLGRQGFKMVNVSSFEKIPYSRLHHCDRTENLFGAQKQGYNL